MEKELYETIKKNRFFVSSFVQTVTAVAQSDPGLSFIGHAFVCKLGRTGQSGRHGSVVLGVTKIHPRM